MSRISLEHMNITVNDAKKTAAELCELFDWKIRWDGASMDGQGHSYHVGNDDQYLALYSPKGGVPKNEQPLYSRAGTLNHIGLVVDDIDAMEAKVKAAGYEPGSHADYEPGRRFYFLGHDGVEYEIVSYT